MFSHLQPLGLHKREREVAPALQAGQDNLFMLD